jgi:ribose transport system permease protein
VLSSLMAGISAVLLVGVAGCGDQRHGTGYELRVIASSVIGGADRWAGRRCVWRFHRRGPD